MKEKVFATVQLMNRVISMEMEKTFPELSFQVKEGIQGEYLAQRLGIADKY